MQQMCPETFVVIFFWLVSLVLGSWGAAYLETKREERKRGNVGTDGKGNVSG